MVPDLFIHFSCVFHEQGHMKIHPGALATNLSKAQTNDNDSADDHNSHSDVKNPEQQEEKQKPVKTPENENSTDPQPGSVASSAEDEPAGTTV